MYIQEFEKAVTTSNKLFNKNIKFNYKDVSYNSKENLEKFSNEISKYLSHLSYKQLVANCSPFHHYIKSKIESLYGCKAYLTIGYVSIDSEDFHKITLEDINKALSTKNIPSSHHSWLTLDNYEILDMTFSTTYGILKDDSNALGGVIQAQSNNLNGMKYHPLLVGDEFFKECNFDLNKIASLMYSK